MFIDYLATGKLNTRGDDSCQRSRSWGWVCKSPGATHSIHNHHHYHRHHHCHHYHHHHHSDYQEAKHALSLGFAPDLVVFDSPVKTPKVKPVKSLETQRWRTFNACAGHTRGDWTWASHELGQWSWGWISNPKQTLETYFGFLNTCNMEEPLHLNLSKWYADGCCNSSTLDH